HAQLCRALSLAAPSHRVSSSAPWPPPPTSPLFPYTTLFRSLLFQRGGDGDLHVHGDRCELDRLPVRAVRRRESHPGWRTTRTGRDRKSTRLNSSHVAISYAVFCVQKKTTAPRLSDHLRPVYE